MIKFRYLLCLLVFNKADGFWDFGTTTDHPPRTESWVRKSRFLWADAPYYFSLTGWMFGYVYSDSYTASIKRSCDSCCGLSIGTQNIGIAALLGRRTLITSANILEPHLTDLEGVRVWCLGRAGLNHTPYRYRIWRIRRIYPRSNNPEHMHGPLGRQVSRHDLAIITTMDQIYRASSYYYRYAEYMKLCRKFDKLPLKLMVWGSGYQTRTHIKENWRIVEGEHEVTDVVNCENYVPKWWGKFICIINKWGFTSVQTGGPLVDRWKKVYGIGCFALNYNEDRVLVFTDLRYYVDRINVMANYTPGDYYEYAYPEWSAARGWFSDGYGKTLQNPLRHIDWRIYPLG